MTADSIHSPQRRDYKRPPAIEAIVDLRWQNSIDFDLAKRAAAKLSRDYPIEEEQAQVATQISYVRGQEPTANTSVVWKGIKRSSNDQADVVRVTTNSFAVIRLAPYTGWESLFARAQRDWTTVVSVVKRQAIERVALRYINRVDIPDNQQSVDFRKYLNVSVGMPVLDWPSPSAYLIQANFPPSKAGFSLNINSGTVVSPMLNHQSLLLDIDVFAERLSLHRDEHIWEMTQAMHEQKNAVFELCITDASRELFNR